MCYWTYQQIYNRHNRKLLYCLKTTNTDLWYVTSVEKNCMEMLCFSHFWYTYSCSVVTLYKHVSVFKVPINKYHYYYYYYYYYYYLSLFIIIIIIIIIIINNNININIINNE